MATLSSHAAAAKEIRKVLKEKFPMVKFWVKSECYSGGDSVSVKWIDGPIYDDVKAIVEDYQEGHFDGMTDMYDDSNRRADIPQVKYVLVSREISEAAITNMVDTIAKKFGIVNKDDDQEWYDKFHFRKYQVIYRELAKVAL